MDLPCQNVCICKMYFRKVDCVFKIHNVEVGFDFLVSFLLSIFSEMSGWSQKNCQNVILDYQHVFGRKLVLMVEIQGEYLECISLKR